LTRVNALYRLLLNLFLEGLELLNNLFLERLELLVAKKNYLRTSKPNRKRTPNTKKDSSHGQPIPENWNLPICLYSSKLN